MPRIRPRWWPFIVVALVLVLVALSSRRTVRAQTESPAVLAEQVQESLQEAIDTRQATQEQQDAWEVEQAELTARYRELQANVAYLEERREAEQGRLEALQDRNRELERRLEESDRLQESLEDTLRAVLLDLGDAVRSDLPFLPGERTRRLRSVREELLQPDTPAAEKLRRVLEALQVEAQYGGTVEVYRDRIVAAGDSLHADVLRLGRLALFWRTPDEKRYGTYDLEDRAWVELPGRNHRALRRAMEMATRLRPVEVIGLPLGEVAP
jgi:hypothetical protein